MPIVTVNGTEIEVDKGTTILQAAAVAGHEVPHFCYHPALSRPANCRMCLVEVERAPKLLPGCYNPVNDGMVMYTESDRVIRARKAVLEFILINHPVDCPICDKAGECKLQDYYFAYDAQESRMRAEKNRKVKAYPIGPNIVYDGERCILCTRCIRFCEEITQTNELTLVERGDMIEVRTFPGQELDNDYSLCTVDVCPVGALTSRDFRFKCRVWLLTSTESVCTGCATGCNIHLDHFRNEVQRYRPRFNPEVNDYWMCDEGRLGYETIHQDRLLYPDNNGAELTWHEVIGNVKDKLSKVIEDAGADAVAFVISPQATCEDLHLARRFYETALQGKARLYVNGNPDGKEDNLLIHKDKNPNTRGIEAVFAGINDRIQPCQNLADDINSGKVKAVHMMDSRLPLKDRSVLMDALGGIDLFILQSMHGADLAKLAHFVLPTCSHAEKDGTFINQDGLAQNIKQAFPAHGSALPDWQVFQRLARAMNESISYAFIRQIRDEMFQALETIEAAKAKALEDAKKAEEEAKAQAAAQVHEAQSENADPEQLNVAEEISSADDWENLASEVLDDDE